METSDLQTWKILGDICTEAMPSAQIYEHNIWTVSRQDQRESLDKPRRIILPPSRAHSGAKTFFQVTFLFQNMFIHNIA